MAGKESINGFLLTLFGYKKATKKPPIFLIVLIHMIAWGLLFLLPVLLYPVRISDNLFIKSELIDKAVLVVIFYLNYYLFIPRYFERRKYLAYAALVVLSFVIYLAQNVVVKNNYLAYRKRPPFQMVQSLAAVKPADTVFGGQVGGDYATAYDMPADDSFFHRTTGNGTHKRMTRGHGRYIGVTSAIEAVPQEMHGYDEQMEEDYPSVYNIRDEDSLFHSTTAARPYTGSFRVKNHYPDSSNMVIATPALVPIIDSIAYAMPTFPAGNILFTFREDKILGVPRPLLFRSLSNAISSFALVLLIGGFIRLAYSFVRNQNERKTLENANLNAEVNFLKSQINPHFLFNTLNSIYSQAHSRSEHTEYSILKLSELLRYVLYESGEEKVALEKDIQYLNNYIDLQRMRLSSKVVIDYSVKGDLQQHRIAPLLLISFIENSFKHGISYSHSSTIHIHLEVFEKTLTLSVINPVIKSDTFTPGGLGLKNVTRRLDLLYPDKYELDAREEDKLYIVKLKINLTDD